MAGVADAMHFLESILSSKVRHLEEERLIRAGL